MGRETGGGDPLFDGKCRPSALQVPRGFASLPGSPPPVYYTRSYIGNYGEDYTTLTEVNMAKLTSASVIKPQLKIQFEQINFKIDTETLEKLRGYAEFINSEQSYIIREALNYLFESDPNFQEFYSCRRMSNSDFHETS